MTEGVTGVAVRRFKPYPSYMSSGVEWLGDVPAHWSVRRLKTIASVALSNVDKKSLEGEESVRLCNYVDVYYNDRITSDLSFMAATATPEQVRRFSLGVGDVLITKDSESWTDIAVPAVVVDDLPDVLAGYHLALLRPREAAVDGRFLARACEAVGPRDQFQIAANGITRFGLTGDSIATAVFAIPPIDEQVKIAAFLDRETAEIDALIAKKERLIQVLQERLAAAVNEAVTRGLTENVTLKTSGIYWLGEIPTTWSIQSLGTLISGIQQGWSPQAEDRRANRDEWAVIKLNAVSRGRFRADEHKALPQGLAPDTRYEISAGDFLVTRSNTPELVGDVCVVRETRDKLMLCDLVYRIRVDAARISSSFLMYWLLSAAGRYQIEVDARGTSQSMVKIAQSHIRSWRVALPPRDEQLAIVRHLDECGQKTAALVTAVTTAINELKRLRAAIVSAAVMGRVDVRGEAA